MFNFWNRRRLASEVAFFRRKDEAAIFRLQIELGLRPVCRPPDEQPQAVPIVRKIERVPVSSLGLQVPAGMPTYGQVWMRGKNGAINEFGV